MHKYSESEKCKIFDSSMEKTIEKIKSSGTIVFELPADNYFLINTTSVKYLTNNGYSGIYVGFQRPCSNIYNLFEKSSIDNSKIKVFDCTDVKSLDIEDLGKKIINELKNLTSRNKFIIIDSLTTAGLVKPVSEIIRFAETIMDVIYEKDFGKVLILFNVVEDLANKEFVQNITLHADKVVNVSECIANYSREVVKSGILT